MSFERTNGGALALESAPISHLQNLVDFLGDKIPWLETNQTVTRIKKSAFR